MLSSTVSGSPHAIASLSGRFVGRGLTVARSVGSIGTWKGTSGVGTIASAPISVGKAIATAADIVRAVQ